MMKRIMQIEENLSHRWGWITSSMIRIIFFTSYVFVFSLRKTAPFGQNCQFSMLVIRIGLLDFVHALFVGHCFNFTLLRSKSLNTDSTCTSRYV